MTRIIAGFAGSLTLATPGAGTRPTSDRVREAIFSALDARDVLDGARVLDLYAGSGALGLEAASRGASHVTLVDRVAAAANACRKNAAVVLRQAPKESGLRVDVSSQSVQAFLAASLASWDVVFMDPPYDLGESELLHNLESLAPRLNPDAIVMLERSSRSPEPTWPSGIALDRRKNYGDTTLWWARSVSWPSATPPE
jgi:16S rRNA (guanine966-N2)-methyltransferase